MSKNPKTLKEKFTLVLSAVKDVSWFFDMMKVSETRTRHAFMAYTCIMFLFGALWSDAWDYCIKNEVAYKIIELIKAVL